MKNYIIVCFLLSVALAQGQDLPIDRKATLETVNLYKNLKRLLPQGCMIGHQDDLAYGAQWAYENGRSDVRDVTGDYPGIYGWELGHLELDSAKNLDGVPFNKIKQYIRDGYGRGGVITISWHLRNPLTGKTAWDPAPGTVAAILPGGSRHTIYIEWLDKVANFLNDLKGPKGEFIPVIFRPFHELNGSWFWWGGKNCTPQELQQLYRLTVTYLRDTRQLHQLLYAFNTDKFRSTEEYLERYPGDDYVDIMGFDIYQAHNVASNEAFRQHAGNMMSMMTAVAQQHNKIPALTEFGYAGVPDNSWWTTVLLPLLKQHRLSYALAWRNGDGKNFYMPFKGQGSAANFVEFYRAPETLFEQDVAKEHVYR